MTDFIDKIKNELMNIQNGVNEILSFKSIIETFKSIFNALDMFFTIFPIEVLLLFIFCAIFLILINNISPTTPRLNITLGSLLYGILFLYIIHLLTGEWKFLKAITTISYIIIPAYFLEFSKLMIKYIKKNFIAKKIENKKDLVQFMKEIHSNYSEFMNAELDFENNTSDLKSSVQKLKNSIIQLESKL
jgi:hypothetical protein